MLANSADIWQVVKTRTQSLIPVAWFCCGKRFAATSKNAKWAPRSAEKFISKYPGAATTRGYCRTAARAFCGGSRHRFRRSSPTALSNGRASRKYHRRPVPMSGSVVRAGLAAYRRLPLCPYKQTSLPYVGMSQMCQTQKSGRATGKSALHSRTDIASRACQVRKVPISDIDHGWQLSQRGS